jgi:hypothetical protein
VNPTIPIVALVVVAAAFPPLAAGQVTRPPRDAPAAVAAAKPFTLKVTADGLVIDVALLATRLGTAVVVGRNQERERITIDLPETSLDAALSALAPHALVDYEIRKGTPAKPIGIYLLGPGDPDPPTNVGPRGVSQGLLITGNTEQPAKDDDPLRITGDKHMLSVFSKKQPLATVAFGLSEVLGVPLEIDGEGTELIDASIQDLPAEDAIASLSPNLKLLVRVEVARLDRTPLRLVVTASNAR